MKFLKRKELIKIGQTNLLVFQYSVFRILVKEFYQELARYQQGQTSFQEKQSIEGSLNFIFPFIKLIVQQNKKNKKSNLIKEHVTIIKMRKKLLLFTIIERNDQKIYEEIKPHIFEMKLEESFFCFLIILRNEELSNQAFKYYNNELRITSQRDVIQFYSDHFQTKDQQRISKSEPLDKKNQQIGNIIYQFVKYSQQTLNNYAEQITNLQNSFNFFNNKNSTCYFKYNCCECIKPQNQIRTLSSDEIKNLLTDNSKNWLEKQTICSGNQHKMRQQGTSNYENLNSKTETFQQQNSILPNSEMKGDQNFTANNKSNTNNENFKKSTSPEKNQLKQTQGKESIKLNSISLIDPNQSCITQNNKEQNIDKRNFYQSQQCQQSQSQQLIQGQYSVVKGSQNYNENFRILLLSIDNIQDFLFLFGLKGVNQKNEFQEIKHNSLNLLIIQSPIFQIKTGNDDFSNKLKQQFRKKIHFILFCLKFERDDIMKMRLDQMLQRFVGVSKEQLGIVVIDINKEYIENVQSDFKNKLSNRIKFCHIVDASDVTRNAFEFLTPEFLSSNKIPLNLQKTEYAEETEEDKIQQQIVENQLKQIQINIYEEGIKTKESKKKTIIEIIQEDNNQIQILQNQIKNFQIQLQVAQKKKTQDEALLSEMIKEIQDVQNQYHAFQKRK